MKSKSPRAAALGLALTACAFGGACTSSTPTPRGTPHLLQVFWVAGGVAQLAWRPEGDASTAFQSAVPPFATEVDFVFDRLLDGTRIEDVTTVDGMIVTTPKEMPPIEVRWPDMAAHPGDPPLKLRVAYNSVNRFGPGTSYVFARPEPPGFPAGTDVTFVLDPQSLTSTTGEPTDAPDEIPVKTNALTVAISPPAGAVAPRFQVPLAFSNRMPPPGDTSPSIHVAAAGVPVPYKLLADASLAARWYVAPADCLGVWPAGVELVVTVDAGLADAFGSPLAMGATATFRTSNAVAADASCSVNLDAGTPDASDAGAADADASEADAPDAGASDAEDAAVDLAAAS